ncbi:MAG: DUF2804 domain-containing protein [Microthrixaceae bacterium]
MTTTEREITEAVRLCTPDGRRLDPMAKGWSRRPLHTANLRGSWGRNKKWDYWAILTGDLVVSVTYADVDYLGIVGIWWCDLATGRTGGHDDNPPGARGVELPDRPGSTPLRWTTKTMSVVISDDERGTVIDAEWREKDGTVAELHAVIELPDGHESLNVVIPWSERRFQYTSKHQARPARGVLRVGGRTYEFGEADRAGADRREAWGVLDVGRGRWPYRNVWNWAGGAGRCADGHVVGLQFGGKWTEGTDFTENGLIIDGRLSKIGDELIWDYSWDEPLGRWSVRSADGSVDVELMPVHDRHTRVEAAVLGMHVHQVFGNWQGTVGDDEGVEHHLRGLLGFAEEARNRW